MNAQNVCVYIGEGLRRYGFGQGHPFGPDRMDAFWNEAKRQGVNNKVCVREPISADRKIIEQFHTREYVDRVVAQSKTGTGLLDYGDTPAFPGVFEAASFVVGSTLDACDRLMEGVCRRAFIPIAGLHHARRGSAGGFCVFNDPGVAVETLRARYGLTRIVYVDIDAHHGDGMFYSFEEDPYTFIADIHEDGRYLYPGTGFANETGRGAAVGTKLNVPMPLYADDDAFLAAWEAVEKFVDAAKPEFILMQCGADGLEGDPITHLRYTEEAHAHAAKRLCALANRHCHGRVVATGGGGYNRDNIGKAWTAIVNSLVEAS
uniref:Acetoin utilization protein AcuC n=1 Tax=Candidatus Kentrum sp. LFY TaxID=2126342 RepID=A0A450V219_9GAMM|nr:MAG: acetoin utilization protein AcuC [Candidatus Kentron sp. LFY]VFK01152.1 MAG: acetoin utilization protein AcuC [Candidatus Kentron sp. LFY]VFK21226.1 MAG: acetoin utilization protein AcuC [Candidatus Kentron sp. LFY]